MSHSKRPVSVEDLLRLKRAERPPAEFWNEFDRQLRAKQLAALVEKRPWWHGVQRGFLQMRRFQLPLGAAAALVVTFVAVRDHSSPPHARQVGALDTEVPTVSAQDLRVPTASSVGAHAIGSTITEAVADASIAPASDNERFSPAAEVLSDVPVVATSNSRGGLSLSTADAFSTITALTGASIAAEPQSPSARFIAANYAAAQAADGVGATLLPVAQGFESRAMPARTIVEPLHQMTPPGEQRRAARYMAAMVSTPAAETSARVTERAASRISAEELYDQVNRFGTRHGGFNVKF
jgi:hypothetical protein